jgi:hypothetical protein
MNYLVTISVSLTLLGAVRGNTEQTSGALDPAKIGDDNHWRLRNATAEFVEMDGKRAVHMRATGDSANGSMGLAIPVGVEFTTGAIELDLKGKYQRPSFLGCAFNITDEKTFEAIYFRPFNFKADEPFQQRAVQYIAWPEHTWDELRQQKPGQFENSVHPAPEPDGWFHARIEVTDKRVQVFVNGAKEPSLVVNRLKEGVARRPVGLLVDVAEGLYANLEVKPARQDGP